MISDAIPKNLPGQRRRAAAAWRQDGFLWVIFPLMLLLTALEIFLSGRDLTQSFLLLQSEVEAMGPIGRNPIVVWTQRGVSLLLLLVAAERIATLLLQRKPMPSALLTWAFLFYWFTSIAAPAGFAAHPRISHEYLYTLFLGLACTLVTVSERDRILDATRDALFVFMLAGWALVPVLPNLVLDTSYSQGFLPGVPRFGGLAAHPVMLGMLSQIALLLLCARPYRRGWLNASAWIVGLGVLFLAQSKTAWAAFLLSMMALYVVRSLPGTVHRAGDPRRGSFGVGLCLAVIGAVVAVLLLMLVADLPYLLDNFFNSREGAQLASLTGRDRIWIVAMEEWSAHPLFGYGLTMWDADYRQSIAMPEATHAHNQFLDTLGRAGVVGALGLGLYALVLASMAIRHARATRGLSLAMFLTVALLSVSEVPLILTDYGSHVLLHFLLIVTLGAAAGATPRVARARVAPLEPTAFRTAA
jgi:O-antigen ligase